MFFDILATVPWNCGERDCPTGWHLANYWIGVCGEHVEYTYDGYSDGDHEFIDEEDVPPPDEVDMHWIWYWRDCVFSGEDPLGQLMVKDCLTRIQKWQVELKYGIAGVSLLGCRRNCRGPWHRDPPKELTDFMLMTKRRSGLWVVDEEIISKKEYLEIVRKDVDGWKAQRSHRLTPKGVASVEVNVPRSQAAVRRDVIAQARRSLKNLEKMRTKNDKHG